MKKYLILGLLSLLLGYFAVADHWFVDERDIYFPITKEQLRVKRQVASDFKPSPHVE